MFKIRRPSPAERANQIESWALENFDRAHNGLRAAATLMEQSVKEHALAADEHRAAAAEHDSLAEATAGSAERHNRVADKIQELLS